jgi:hypothetical protein
MTPRQRELSRHALGLPNDRRRSYRNRFFAPEGHQDYDEWKALVSAGLAKHRGTDGHAGELFTLTIEGAKAALLKRETLCPEDFPDQSN